MSLGDRQHVEAVSIMRALVERAEPVMGRIDPIKAAYVWLDENHPAPAVYMNAVHELATAEPMRPRQHDATRAELREGRHS